MVRLQQIKLKIPHTDRQLFQKVCKLLRVGETAFTSYRITRRSLDARKKPELYYVYTVEAELKDEPAVRKRMKNKQILFLEKEKPYCAVPTGKHMLPCRPVVIGTGPAGLFCGYQLARLGYRPILLERGASVEERMKDVEAFWASGVLNPCSNVQFGEGGAGTFSDGKLNTMVHDTEGRGARVLEIFVENGAPKEILYQSKPHIGTDILADVVRNMREYIIEHGGEVRFHTQVTDILTIKEKNEEKLRGLSVLHSGNNGKLYGPRTLDREDAVSMAGEDRIETEVAVLAIGHSARDTFSMLSDRDIPMEAKSFAVGVRMEHPQRMIDLAQYGTADDPALPSAAYKLTANLPSGRGVYTFCICPGGYVVNASSEEGRLAVNGMSYHARDGVNANSAVVVTVTPKDYMHFTAKQADRGNAPASEAHGGAGDRALALAGVEFQRRLEEAAYRAGNGRIPVQLFRDFCSNHPSTGPGEILPQMKGGYTWGNVRDIFPKELADALEEGILSFEHRLHGYARPDALVSGVESRTSSPVRILRDDTLQSRLGGLYPCGEGAGYAGGITSAAMDGLKVAQAIAGEYAPLLQ